MNWLQEWARVLANHDAAVQRVNDTLATFREQLAQAESRFALADQPRRIHDLIEASSLGTPDAVALRKEGGRILAGHLTGMPEEQADWENSEEGDRD